MSSSTQTSAGSNHRHCVLPGPTEEELVTLPGAEPGTALRVRVEAGRDGYVRLEHLAYNDGLGCYTQKSFCIPGDLLAALVPELRKADCLIPRRRRGSWADGDPIRLPVPSPAADHSPDAERREA